ncbi:cation transporter [Alkalilimnicola ehrlichii]|uniref:Cation transporter n=1 Tax=Alkalilimnicola ehrlichii TaxID=351052 RepID=A0A3E0WFL4_9GAMM|nr:cation transporter [Alkalilimnicola ehrlichii]RFA31734.1 cation transporter [Alkalilimnicola ehrlichii]
MKTELGGLRLSAAAALTVGIVGVSFALLSNSQAILLDGLFNLCYFATTLVTFKVLRMVHRPDDDQYPFGYGYFESLVNAGKGLLILGISVIALFDSLAALLTGGRAIAVGLAVGYAMFATFTCTLTALSLHFARKRIDSPLLQADCENWVVNSIISAAVLLTFCLVPLIEALEWDMAVPYVDPVLVGFVVLVCIGVPIRMAGRAFTELLNKTPPDSVAKPVTHAIEKALAGLPTERIYTRMVRPGRTLYVIVHVVLNKRFPLEGLEQLDRIRHDVDAAVRNVHAHTVVDVLFTAHERWAAPIAPSNGAYRTNDMAP